MKICSEVKEIMAEGYISTEDMTVDCDRISLTEQIEFHMRRGEAVTLIRPNSAGKSTILKSIIRQLGFLEGTIYLDGQSVEGMTEKQIARRMSVLMTERIHPELTTCKNVVGTGKYPRTGRLGILTTTDHEEVREVMGLVYTGELADRNFMEINGGQKQRILLARAICQGSEVIVLGEPASFLDVRHRLGLLTILKDLVHEKKVAMLMSPRELDLTQELSDSVVYVEGDATERYGTPEEILVSPYIKELYGITKGSYHVEMGCPEMEPVKGEPKVFVIGRNRSGIPVYRRLQRQGIPFAAGILHENDMGYPVAKAPASEMISEAPFESTRGMTYERVVSMLESCEQMICYLPGFGTLNGKNRELAGVRTCLKDLRRI